MLFFGNHGIVNFFKNNGFFYEILLTSGAGSCQLISWI
jgi:hypothetical protein